MNMLENVRNRQEAEKSLFLYKLSKRERLVRPQRGTVEPRPVDFEKPLRRLFPKKNVIGEIIFRLSKAAQASLQLLKTRRAGGDLPRWLGTVPDKPGRMDQNGACRLDYRLQMGHEPPNKPGTPRTVCPNYRRRRRSCPAHPRLKSPAPTPQGPQDS